MPGERDLSYPSVVPGQLARSGSSAAHGSASSRGTLAFWRRASATQGQGQAWLRRAIHHGWINQNIFVHAARQAGVKLRTWNDVRGGDALTSSLTHELEAD